LIVKAKKTALAEMLKVPDRARAERVTEAVPGAIKLGIAALQKACDAR
jgi:hypothetical protein